MTNHQFPPLYRIRRAADFRRAYQRRCAASDGILLILGHPNGLPYPRIGLSVSRKVGGAVVRNRWKRLLREAFRLTRQRLPAGLDMVVIPQSAAEPELSTLAESLRRLASRVASRLLPSE